MNKYKAKIWITDTTNGFENIEEDSKWLVEKFIPQTIDSSCESIFFIMREDSSLKDEIYTQKEALSQYFDVKIVEDLVKL